MQPVGKGSNMVQRLNECHILVIVPANLCGVNDRAHLQLLKQLLIGQPGLEPIEIDHHRLSHTTSIRA
jgi:hypothetical protein